MIVLSAVEIGPGPKENDDGAVSQVERLWTACGARVSRMPAEEHDQVLAAVSHLPHLLAFALVHEVAAKHMQGRYQNVRAYLAGPPPAVDGAIRMLLLQAKLTADNIRYDKFS